MEKNRNSQTPSSEQTPPYPSVILLGPPGSGKGTLSKLLCGDPSFFHLSTGEIFRGLDPASTPGKIYHSYAGQGQLLPDDLTLSLWLNYVEGMKGTNRYFPARQLLLLDGIPRTVNQARLLEPYIDVLHIIVLEIRNPEALLKRMQHRALVEGRTDDSDPEVLRTRMRVYETQTRPLVDHYPASLITRVDAEQLPLQVLRDVIDPLLLALRTRNFSYNPTKGV